MRPAMVELSVHPEFVSFTAVEVSGERL